MTWAATNEGGANMGDEVFQWVGSAVAILTLFGAGVKFILHRIDTRTRREREWQALERAKLEEAFTARINTLEGVVNAQQNEMLFLQGEIHRHIRHVGVLEGLLRANGIPVPAIEPVAVVRGKTMKD